MHKFSTLKLFKHPLETLCLLSLFSLQDYPSDFSVFREKEIEKMPSGEVFLGAFFQVLFDRLASQQVLKFATREGIRLKLKQWETTLKRIEALLIDAEEKKLTDGTVKMWLDDLQDWAYDVEDILDEFTTDELCRKLKADDQEANTGKVRSLIPDWFTGLNPYAVMFNMTIKGKIKEITSRLDEIYMRREILGLREIAKGTSNAASERPQSTSMWTETDTVVRDEDKAKILEMVLRAEPSGESNFSVIPIVGIGGIGKTTLACEVFHDKAMEDFNPKAWVHVSDDSDVLRISKVILKSMIGPHCFYVNSLEWVQKQIKAAVAGKKFLLVLNDVWKMNHGLWESLKCPLMAGAPGSKLIVTTRDEGIATTVAGPKKFYKLEALTDYHCWSLFKKHAFEGRDIGAHPNVELIREKVIEKCRGLPLAARILGGLLQLSREDEWEDILNSKIWDLTDGSDVLPVLKLSYHFLPADLKRCFAYCAVLPKDYEFEEKELILLWMAEGLIQQPKYEQPRSKKQLEDVGRKFFHDLLSRSIFHNSRVDNSKFTMHDLVHDLARWVSRETCFRLEDALRANNESKVLKRAQHSSYTRGYYDSKGKFEVFNKVEHLRTFLPMKKGLFDSESYIANTVLSDLLPKLTKLRVLSLKDYYITELSDSISRLKHLRYLNLSNSEIRSLPESTSSLFNLQILILRSCSRLLSLPTNMRHLINLQYLDILGAIRIREMPKGMKELKSLLRLSNFNVGKTGSSLRDLKYLVFLRGELNISSLENAVDLQGTREFILNDKEELEVLLLEWRPIFDSLRAKGGDENVLNVLQPHKNIKELTIRGYGDTRFPSWLGDPSFSNMVALTLDDCLVCTSLPPLGLLSTLKSLLIKQNAVLKSVGLEFYGEGCSKPFPSLESLCFEGLAEWEHWEPIKENEKVEVFPHLQRLSISLCPKLSGRLPHHLPSLETLAIYSCEELIISFSSLSMLRELHVNGCKQMAWSSPVDSKSLKSMFLSNVSVIGNWLKQGFQNVESLKIVDCEEFVDARKNETFLVKPPQMLPGFNSLKELCIKRCNALTSLPNEIQYKGGLESLKIERCDSLEYIIRGQPSPSLKKLDIRHCKKLQCLFNDKGLEDNVNISTRTSLLRNLRVSWCPSLTCLSSSGQLLATLTEIVIWHCSNITTLSPRGQLPAALTLLDIWECTNFMSLVPGGQFPDGLKFLRIDNCPRIKLITERFDSDMSLERIWISKCASLNLIPEGLHNLSNLHFFNICGCPNLVSLPGGSLPNNILEFTIYDCEKLKALPEHIHSFSSLRKLEISKCPSIMSVPEEGFPRNLTSLRIEGLNIYNPLIDWGLSRLTSLVELEIVGCPDVVSFPPAARGMSLPSSLTKLNIERLPDLKHLPSEGFQDLNSLVFFRICDCQNVMCLPGLPSSLLELYIKDCYFLRRRCQRDKGPDWFKIKDIPCVYIDGRFIYAPEWEA